MSENELGVEAVRVLVGDHGVEVLRDILQEMGAGDEYSRPRCSSILPIPPRYVPRWHDVRILRRISSNDGGISDS